MTTPEVNGGSAAGEDAQSRDHDIFRIFVSFSSKNNREGEVSKFVRDLRRLFQALSGFEDHEYDVFLSDDRGSQGTNWPAELNREVNRADVLMPVMSPDYFRSEWCSQEWGAFGRRLTRLARIAQVASFHPIEVPERIIPVVWFPEELPPAARGLRIGWGPTQVPDYREVGLALLREEDPRQYATAVRLLAMQLKKLVEDEGRLPRLATPVDVPNAELAFPPRHANTPCAAWQYYLVHGSVSEADLNVLESTVADLPRRDPRYYYGEGSEQWDPFRNAPGHPGSESRVRRVIEDEAWSHRMRPVNTGRKVLDFRFGVPAELTAPRGDARTVVIVPLDAWLVQCAAWKNHTEAVAALPGARVVLLAPKASDEQFRESWERILNGRLQSALNGSTSGDNVHQRAPDHPDMLVRDLRQLLPKACSGPSPWRRPGGQPGISGPGGGSRGD